ncbi:serine hydrolase [Heliorestis convoluta]|uniref:Peptidoglycan-binding domain 1 protein n=1 Tax=Heliorestis convoluta TaxID=356322 RepID=A0A5Q2MZT4_9FIRM|nr:serine hydrolase [Heliorestis convoluta]QGG46963.1 Peptidoglycan-binding domain 1 protein [Heliorestis convoluta]
MASLIRKGGRKRGFIYVSTFFFLTCTLLASWFMWKQNQISSLQFIVYLNEREDKTVVAEEIDYSQLEQKIKSYLYRFSGTYGLYVEDLATGATLEINADKSFPAASVIKVPLILFLYSLAIDDRIDLDEEMVLEAGDIESGTGILKTEAVGTTYTLRQLAQYTIEYSDNSATNMLMRRLGRENFYFFLRLMGAEIIPLGPGKGNIMCARDAALYLKGVMALRELHPEYGQEVLQYLLNSKFDDRIPAGIPKGIQVANKIGTQVNVVNDAAIVLLNGKPYVIAILCSHIHEQEAVGAIAQISKLVFEYHRQYVPLDIFTEEEGISN